MPIYLCKCKKCRASFEEFATMTQCHKIRCPHCRRIAQRVPTLPHRERHFAGSEAMSEMEGCHPSQVAEMRQKFPMVRWTDEGRVVYERRSDETALRNAKMAEIRRVEAEVAESNERAKSGQIAGAAIDPA